uniref:uncharacterized protein C6orf62 homolog n=1 Tax=Myxine glutinosa TaxID=7769 RepID=UPI00358EA19D
MADSKSRRDRALGRLRAQLQQKNEALADQFEFQVYIAFICKGQKPPALFQAAEVWPLMAGQFEQQVAAGVQELMYSELSSHQLMLHDPVQLHVPCYRPLRKDLRDSTQNMDFLLWPRRDIEEVKCLVFSRWKGASDEPYRHIQAQFDFKSSDYSGQLAASAEGTGKDQRGLVLGNPDETMFLFLRQHDPQRAGVPTVWKLSSLCVYLPQSLLNQWSLCSLEDLLQPCLH